MSALYVLLSLLWASCVAFGASDSIDATTKATPNLVTAAATASTSSSKPPRTTSTQSFDDASLSRAKESYQSSFYASLHGSGTTFPTTSYSTPLAVCTSLASVDQRICNRAVMSVHNDGINNEPYSVDIEQCSCTSFSKMIGCYDGNTQSQSQYLSQWSSKSCSELITGRLSASASGSISPTSSSFSSRTGKSSSGTSTSSGAANRKTGPPGVLAECVGMLMIGGLINI